MAEKRLVKRHPWEKVRDHFVEQPEEISLRELADAYGIAYQSVKVRSADEKWRFLRAQYQSQLAQQKTRARVKKLVDEATNFDDQSLKAAQMGQAIIAGRLAQIAEVFSASQAHHKQAVDRLRQGGPLDRADLYSVVNYKEIGELATAILRFQEVGRKALGTDVQKLEIDGQIDHAVEISIAAEMAKDDPDRQAALLDAMQRAGLIQLTIDEADVDDAEVIGEETDAVELEQ